MYFKPLDVVTVSPGTAGGPPGVSLIVLASVSVAGMSLADWSVCEPDTQPSAKTIAV
jgi:hypothetical protein